MNRNVDRRAITFRINLANDREKQLYDHLMDKEHGECSMSNYVKSILISHFTNEDKEKLLADSFAQMQECQKKALVDMKKLVKEEMHNHDVKLLALLASNGSCVSTVKVGKEKKMDLPSKSTELPKGMDTVLSMFE